jgi:large subunit ribosomal protein L21
MPQPARPARLESRLGADMYAVFEDGSRQYRVSEGDVVKVDYREAEVGQRVEFPRVLLAKDGDNLAIGRPLIEGMRVLGEVVDHPSIKVYVQHFRRRKNYRRLRGHRQWYTAVKVSHILPAGAETPPPPQPKAAEAPAPESPPAEGAAHSPPA